MFISEEANALTDLDYSFKWYWSTLRTTAITLIVRGYVQSRRQEVYGKSLTKAQPQHIAAHSILGPLGLQMGYFWKPVSTPCAMIVGRARRWLRRGKGIKEISCATAEFRAGGLNIKPDKFILRTYQQQ